MINFLALANGSNSPRTAYLQRRVAGKKKPFVLVLLQKNLQQDITGVLFCALTDMTEDQTANFLWVASQLISFVSQLSPFSKLPCILIAMNAIHGTFSMSGGEINPKIAPLPPVREIAVPSDVSM